MEIKADLAFNDRTVTIDTRIRYKLRFSKYLEFKKNLWEQEITVDSYVFSHYGVGIISFTYDDVVYTVTMTNLDMIAEIRPT